MCMGIYYSSFRFIYPEHTAWRRTILCSIHARCGIRTHEANATDLKSVPFDRSGNRANERRPFLHLAMRI